MTVVLIVVVLLIAVVLALSARALLRKRPTRGAHQETASAEPATQATGTTDATTSAAEDTWNDVHGVTAPDGDPAGPPAAIHMAVVGTHPWSPARVFLGELKAEGYETTVELPDLVVVRDDDRRPVTVREPSGPPGHLVITAEPEQLPGTLEVLVRSLLTATFTLVRAEGRDVHLADDDGSVVRLTVTELALA